MRCTWLLVVRIKARSFTVCINLNPLRKYSKINKLVSVNPSGEPLDSVDAWVLCSLCSSTAAVKSFQNGCRAAGPRMVRAKKATFLIRLFGVAAPLRLLSCRDDNCTPSGSFGTGERIDLNLTSNLRQHILFFSSKKTCVNLDGASGGEPRLEFLVPWTLLPPPPHFSVFVFESVDRYAEV